MNPDMRNIDDVVRRHLPSASDDQMERGGERVLHELKSNPGQPLPQGIPADVDFSSSATWRRVSWRRVSMMAAAAAVLLAVFVGMRIAQHAGEPSATVASVDGALYRVVDGKSQALAVGEKIGAGETVRTNGGAGSMLDMEDGSRIEMRSQAEFWMERANDGVRIHLNKGDILVTAAKQHAGHLYVQTKDMTVSVVGTIFLVRAEEEGSRVAVIEGEVRVKQGDTEKSLFPGQQVATNPLMEQLPVKEEVSWSKNADVHIAMLQQTVPQPVATATSQTPPEPRVAFDVVSIRPVPAPAGGGRGVYGAEEGCLLQVPQIDPARLLIRGSTLTSLIAMANADWADSRGGCVGLTTTKILSGGAPWVGSDLWEIEAVIPPGPADYTAVPGPRGAMLAQHLGPRIRTMLKTLLAERFKVVLRQETKDMPVYFLTVGKDGFKPNGTPSHLMLNGQPMRLNGVAFGQAKQTIVRRLLDSNGNPYASFSVWKTTIAEYVPMLFALAKRPVLDRTGLAGEFDFHVDYNRNEGSNRPSFIEAIQEVGLKFEDGRAPIEVWVIEQAEKPSEN
jgi:uncharacterized protein (TIGR03435 family)